VELKKQVKEVIINGLNLINVTPDQITNDSPLFGDDSDFGFDSLDAVELVVLIKKEFGVEIGDMETATDAFASINALTEYIAKNSSDS